MESSRGIELDGLDRTHGPLVDNHCYSVDSNSDQNSGKNVITIIKMIIIVVVILVIKKVIVVL